MDEDLAKSGTVAVIRRTLALAQAVYPIPWWLVWAAVVVIAAIVVAVERLDVAKLLRAWADGVRPGMEPPAGAPPMDMPSGGMSVPGKEWTGGEP